MALLPFKRFNRNWYSAMAGGALLANSEIAGGMYLFERCGGDYTVVCKELHYKFFRPCFGPAVYKVEPQQALEEHIAKGGAFNIDITLDILQQITPRSREGGSKDRRVGRCEATFHVCPKELARARKERRTKRMRNSQQG